MQSSKAPAARRTEALASVVELYERWGKPEKAEEYRRLLAVPGDRDRIRYSTGRQAP